MYVYGHLNAEGDSSLSHELLFGAMLFQIIVDPKLNDKGLLFLHKLLLRFHGVVPEM